MDASSPSFGRALPTIRTDIPGPHSQRLGDRLRSVESRNITRLLPEPPIFWVQAAGANVRDADDNVFIDLTAGFGVAAAGHAHPAVTAAIARQAANLPHALGDVHPAAIKVELLETLASIAPPGLSVGILGSSGAEAVEAALKTALLRTGRPGILAFEGSYHGLTYGALAVTHRSDFREPFAAQLSGHVRFAPFPTSEDGLDAVLSALDEILADQKNPIGTVIVEPIQGRGGIRLPAPGFLRALRDRCDGRTRVLIFDEIYTGLGRTGRWFACQHWGITPDILTAGKGLTGSLPLSVALGSAEVMEAWPISTGEAIHTSTFLGNPIGCAAAIAQIETIRREGLIERAEIIGKTILERTENWPGQLSALRETRGLGALRGLAFEHAEPPHALRIADRMLQAGVIVLAEGPYAEVLAITPPLAITDEQLEYALEVLQRCSSDM
jgi:4-aminobutyrate aminotransferase-like enzyme